MKTNNPPHEMCKFYFILYLCYSICMKQQTSAHYFPANFLFGAATSAYQIEGAWNLDGKGENIWDRYTHTHPNVTQDKQNGDIATNAYHLYKEDSTILKEIGFDVYRFSISWARILPNGDLSKINQAGIDHYNYVVNDLIRKKIQPMVTIYHWDLPQKLEDMGGWLNSSIVDHVTNYADILFHYLGDRVKWWSTVNEPINIVKGYAGENTLAPSKGLGISAAYKVVHNILLSHGRVYRWYDKKYRKKQNGKISIVLDYETCFPKTNKVKDKEAAERYYQFIVGIFANPIYSKDGDYPELVRNIVNKNSKKDGEVKSRLPKFTMIEKFDLIGTSDYFSLNHYTSLLCSDPSQNDSQGLTYFSFLNEDMNVHLEQDPYWPKTGQVILKIVPQGIREAINKISKEYQNVSIFITENGYSDLSSLKDYKRITFYKLYLQEVLKAIYNDGCKVIGYIAWTLMDNFEWLAGYDSKFGLVQIDYNSTKRTRTRKLSSYWFESLIKSRKIPEVADWILRS